MTANIPPASCTTDRVVFVPGHFGLGVGFEDTLHDELVTLLPDFGLLGEARGLPIGDSAEKRDRSEL